MPIPPDIRRQYYSKESGWPETRARILDRAQHCCERCGAPNGLYILRGADGAWFDAAPGRGLWIRPDDLLVDRRPPCERGIIVAPSEDALWPLRLVTVVLTIGHLNHTPGDDRDENLGAWCQFCHLSYDAEKHADTRKVRKDAARPLLAMGARP